jgi:hypothetical protein
MFQDFFPVGSLVANAPITLSGQIGLVNGGFAPYGGTVTISDVTGPKPVVLGVGTVDSNAFGSFPVTVTFTTVGTRLIRADYSGDANRNPTSSTYHMPIPVTLAVAISEKQASRSTIGKPQRRALHSLDCCCLLACAAAGRPRSPFSACSPSPFAELVAVPCPLRTPALTPARTRALTIRSPAHPRSS